MNKRRQRREHGQALVLALLLVLVGLLALFFMFSAGQVAATKARLTNAADAAAYSAALWRARVLNFDAYANRAIVAQEVAVAQALTLVSWSKYFEHFTQNAAVLAAAYPPLAPVLDAAAKVATQARTLTEVAAADEVFWRAAAGTGYKEILQASQEMLHLSAGVFGSGAVANEIARANDPSFFAYALSDAGEFERFTRRYASDPDRERIRDIVLRSLDPFTSGPRSEDQILWLLPSSCVLSFNSLSAWFQLFRKRGGTVLAPGLERWEAADTASMHDNRRSGFLGLSCSRREIVPLGWGAVESGSPKAGTILANPGNVAINRAALAAAVAEIGGAGLPGMDSYGGISRVRELNYEGLANRRFPTSSLAVLARVEHPAVRTANTLNLGAGRLRLFERFAGERIWALAAAEVYFRRPPDAGQGTEYASLYSPYWQARLAEPSVAQRLAAESYVH